MEKIRKGKAGARSRFAPALKRKIVLEHHHGTGPLIATAKKYGIDRTTLVNWIKWYEQDQASLLTLGAMEAQQQQADSQSEPITPAESAPVPQDIKALQAELQRAQVKLACLESLIDITERDLGIDIRKKAGTKSSEE
jgi:transposase-like protein